MEELLGKPIVDKIQQECERFVEKRNGVYPTLAILRVGEKEADISYGKVIKKLFLSFGLEVKDYQLPEDCSNEEFQEVLWFFNPFHYRLIKKSTWQNLKRKRMWRE